MEWYIYMLIGADITGALIWIHLSKDHLEDLTKINSSFKRFMYKLKYLLGYSLWIIPWLNGIGKLADSLNKGATKEFYINIKIAIMSDHPLIYKFSNSL